jgi:hypothetical protein
MSSPSIIIFGLVCANLGQSGDGTPVRANDTIMFDIRSAKALSCGVQLRVTLNRLKLSSVWSQ